METLVEILVVGRAPRDDACTRKKRRERGNENPYLCGKRRNKNWLDKSGKLSGER